MKKDVIIALDFGTVREAIQFLEPFAEKRPFIKVGMELFYAAGTGFIEQLAQQGYPIFLDLKLHDIPNTVERTMRVLSHLGVQMVNLHASGGSEMMQRAKEGLAKADGSAPLLIAVTQLTSTNDETLQKELCITRTMEETVLHYAKLAQTSGLDGVVCSPWEAKQIKACCGQNFLTVTPGIRFADSETDDQKRIMTPASASAAGADYIVVGRPITKAENPLAAYEACSKAFLEGVCK